MFCNMYAIMISKGNHGESINWVVIMYFQLLQELIKRDKCHKNMIKGTTKKEPKNDVCHFAIVIKVIFQKWFPLKGV